MENWGTYRRAPDLRYGPQLHPVFHSLRELPGTHRFIGVLHDYIWDHPRDRKLIFVVIYIIRVRNKQSLT